jgi:hypothetical protein
MRIRMNDNIRRVQNRIPVRVRTSGVEAAIRKLQRLSGFVANFKKRHSGPIRVPIEATVRKLAAGDGPGAGAGASGSAIARARIAARGLPVSLTSSYRSPSHNAAIGGSPTSYHLDRNNPAGDWGGPTWALNALHMRLVRMGGWRELLWQVPGHYDHVHAARSGGARGGWTMVGEGGRELVRLPHGSKVYPHGQSEQMMAGGGHRCPPAVVEFHASGSRADRLLVELLRDAVRVRGGNVQTVLGAR